MNPLKYLRSLTVISCLLMLGGCTGMNGGFSCDETSGDHCMSVSQTNTLAKEGRAGQSANASVSATQQESTTPLQAMTYPLKAPAPGVPVRAGESVQKLWIAPWVDKDHTFHEPDNVFFVTTPSHWNTLSVQAVSGDDS